MKLTENVNDALGPVISYFNLRYFPKLLQARLYWPVAVILDESPIV